MCRADFAARGGGARRSRSPTAVLGDACSRRPALRLIGLVAALTVVQVFAVTPSISDAIVLGLVVTMVCFLPMSVPSL